METIIYLRQDTIFSKMRWEIIGNYTQDNVVFLS